MPRIKLSRVVRLPYLWNFACNPWLSFALQLRGNPPFLKTGPQRSWLTRHPILFLSSFRYGACSLMWPATTQTYWNKKTAFRQNRIQLPQDWFGTLTGLPFHANRQIRACAWRDRVFRLVVKWFDFTIRVMELLWVSCNMKVLGYFWASFVFTHHHHHYHHHYFNKLNLHNPHIVSLIEAGCITRANRRFTIFKRPREGLY